MSHSVHDQDQGIQVCTAYPLTVVKAIIIRKERAQQDEAVSRSVHKQDQSMQVCQAYLLTVVSESVVTYW